MIFYNISFLLWNLKNLHFDIIPHFFSSLPPSNQIKFWQNGAIFEIIHPCDTFVHICAYLCKHIKADKSATIIFNSAMKAFYFEHYYTVTFQLGYSTIVCLTIQHWVEYYEPIFTFFKQTQNLLIHLIQVQLEYVEIHGQALKIGHCCCNQNAIIPTQPTSPLIFFKWAQYNI